MTLIKFKSMNNNDELIILSKHIFRIMEIKDMPYGDHRADGKVWEYSYDIVFNGEFMQLGEDELQECIENMKIVVGE